MAAPWFVHSLLAVTAIGGMMALFKIPTTRGHNKYVFSFLSFLVGVLLSGIFFNRSIAAEPRAVLFGLAWGIGYALLVMLQMEMLKRLDTNALFPITSMSSHVLVVLLGLTFFRDQISFLQGLGIALAFVIIGMYNRAHKHITFENGLFVGALSIVALSATNKFIQKLGSITIETHNFIFWQLFFAMIGALGILLVVKRKEWRSAALPSAAMVGWSVALGILNFIGTVEIVKALSMGPFSLVYTINSFYVLITSLIAWKFFGERLTRQKVAFLFLAIFAVILIGLG